MLVNSLYADSMNYAGQVCVYHLILNKKITFLLDCIYYVFWFHYDRSYVPQFFILLFYLYIYAVDKRKSKKSNQIKTNKVYILFWYV